MKYALGNMLNGAGGLNPDGLALDLQFAADKTLTARRGPSPVFTRGSGNNGGTTYFGPNIINVEYTYGGGTYNVSLSQDQVVNGRWQWKGGDAEVYFANPNWLLTHDSNLVATSASTTSWRPDLANWSGTGVTVTTGNTFGIVKAANDEPRFDHDPVTLASRGLLIEESRTNLVFPSDTLTTQTRTVTAVAHTLSFYGTGTVVLSGVHSATVTGTGSYPTRTTLTFTPTAGSLTLTVTGSVTQAQLEAGSFATSYIPTTTASVVRSADVCSITGADFTGIYNQPELTIFCEYYSNPASLSTTAIGLSNATSLERINVGHFAGPFRNMGFVADDGTTQASPSFNANPNQLYKSALGAKINSFQLAVGGILATKDTIGTMPTLTLLNVGKDWNAIYHNNSIRSIRVYKKQLVDAKLQAITA